MIVINGSYGEGGGQVLRTSLTLAALLGEPIRIENIRAKRRRPGLQAQHLTGVWAIAQVCGAELEDADFGSLTLIFRPTSPPQAGEYSFDVAEARKGGSAGATSLVFQTLFLPLALASGQSHLTIRGGTHVAWSPPFHYLQHVYLPTLAHLGLEARVEVGKWGWYPIGGGEMTAAIRGRKEGRLPGLNLTERGELKRLWGISATSNLPAHIGQRQKKRAEETLRKHDFDPQIEIVDAPSPGTGTVVFLVAEYEHAVAGFSSLGKRGKPAEKVAEEACREFIAYHQSGTCLDKHLADQLILPLALASGASAFTTCEITQHLLTNVWVVEQFLDVRFEIEGEEGEKGRVRLTYD
jgi:RNA 3'-terminal phosphate cyclase (ATP)